MTQNVIGTLSSIFFITLDCKDHFKSEYNFFSRIFVTVYFVAIFNFIGYANNTQRVASQ